MTDLQAAWLFFIAVFAIMFYYSSLGNAKSTAYWRGRKDGSFTALGKSYGA